MSRDDIIRMVREAGSMDFGADSSTHVLNLDVLARFAALVAATEREACARLCDGQHDRARTSPGAARAEACAAAIRARGEP